MGAGERMRASSASRWAGTLGILLSLCLWSIFADNTCETDGSVQLPGTYWSYLHSYPTNFTTRCFDTCIPVKGNWTGVCPKKLFIKVTGLTETSSAITPRLSVQATSSLHVHLGQISV